MSRIGRKGPRTPAKRERSKRALISSGWERILSKSIDSSLSTDELARAVNCKDLGACGSVQHSDRQPLPGENHVSRTRYRAYRCIYKKL